MIVVVGLAFEARIAAGPGVQVICSGDGRNLAADISRAIADDCRGLISFGVAGGLAPDLPPGTCVVGSAIVSGTAQMPTDQTWSQKLLKAIPDAVHGLLVGVPAPIADPAAKRALYLKIRVITDPAVRALPEAAVAAMRPNGTTDIGAMIRSVMKRPQELPALLRTALDARAARATLMRGRQVLGPSLGLL